MNMNIFSSSGGDAKFFSTTKKGEIYEIKAELNSDDKEKKKTAVKKVIANMTVGKDVSSLFPDVLKNMQTEDIELKKLVYLYLMNYAKSQPELAILAVNTFVKDCDDNNPLLRALAIRTMGCIRVDKIIDYLSQPLGKCLKDPDPYVRKTAALVVAKFFDINPVLCEQNGFFEDLQRLLTDSNPMVVANTVAALSEIMEEMPSSRVLDLNPNILNKLLAALNECFEWGQIFILEALAKYKPVDSQEAQSIAERVFPRLGHGNASVVLSSVRVLLKLADMITDVDFVRQLYKKLAPPLVSQLSNDPEVQYIALRNIGLILRKKPDILNQELKVFFCKYNDPPYVKREKLEIIVRLTNEKNIEMVLAELKEYATEVDVEFVRNSIRAIGRCALTIDKASERCIATLLDLIKTKVNYVLQSCIIVIKDIFRKYPKKYESLIPTLCENLDTLDDPEAKASMVWIIGEYGERILNAEELLGMFVETFAEDPTIVQMQVLTAAVKLFLKKPATMQNLVQTVLQLSTTGSYNPDLRDRGYIYWRLLSTDPNTAKAIVLAERPPITGEVEENISGSLLDELINNLATVSSILYKPAASLSKHAKLSLQTVNGKKAQDEDADSGTEDGPTPTSQPAAAPAVANGGSKNLMDDLLDLGFNAAPAPVPAAASAPKTDGSLLDLLDVGISSAPAPSTFANKAGPGMDLLGELLGNSSISSGGGAGAGVAAPGGAAPGLQTLLSAQQGQGMEVSSRFVRRNGQINLDLRFTNHTAQPMSGFGIQFNTNTFRVAPGGPISLAGVAPGASQDTTIPIVLTGSQSITEPINLLQVALKNNVSVFYTSTKFPTQVLCQENGGMEPAQYPPTWTQITDEKQATLSGLQLISTQNVVEKLEHSNIFIVVQRKNPQNMDTLYLAAKILDVPVLSEMIVHPNMSSVKMACKSSNPLLAAAFIAAIESVLRGQ